MDPQPNSNQPVEDPQSLAELRNEEALNQFNQDNIDENTQTQQQESLPSDPLPEKSSEDEGAVTIPSGSELQAELIKQGSVKAIIWEEIVAKGYDTLEFNPFFATFKEEHQIQEGQWTLTKLKEVLAKFKETHSPKFPEHAAKMGLSSLKAAEKKVAEAMENIESQAPVEEIPVASRVRTQINEAKEKVYVQKSEPTVLNGVKNLTITVTDWQLSKGGVFSGDHIRFTVKTEPMGWVVTRKHKEFARLKHALDKLHPGVLVPNILKKNEKEKFDEESNRKRIYVYDRFLKDCARNEEIRSTKFFVEFLSVDDRAKFIPIKKAVEKITKVSKLDELSALSGEVPLDLNPEYAGHSVLYEAYLTQAEPIFKEVKALSKRLSAELEKTAGTLNEIGNHFSNLHKISEAFNKKATIDQDPIEGYLNEIPYLVKSWSESLLAQAAGARENIVCFLKYSIYESQAFKEMNLTRSKLQTEFDRLTRELTPKKEKLFATGDLTKWEADPTKLRLVPKEELLSNKALAFEYILEKESLPLKQFKDSYGFYNYSMYVQTIKKFEAREEAWRKNFTELAKKQIDITTKHQTYLAHFVTELNPSKIEASE